MQDLHEGWGEEIARCMKEQGVSGRELARRCGVDASQISRVISGKRNADDELKWKIAGALGVRMDLLFSYPRVVPPAPLAAA